MRKKRRLHVGVIFSTLDDTCQCDIWNGIVEHARKNDIHLTAYVGAYQTNNYDFASHFETCFEIIKKSKSLDGIIMFSGFIAGAAGNEVLEKYSSMLVRLLPLVSVSYIIPGTRSVLADNIAGIYDAVEHLIQVHGKRKIAFVKGPDGHPEAEDRFDGYKRALAANGIAFDERCVFPGSFSVVSGQLAMEKLLETPGLSADAIVACDDATAVGVINGLKNHGLLVPADIAVAGFDDDRDSATFIPSISTARQDFYEIGLISAEALLNQMNGKPAEEVTYVSPVFMTRQSCGCLDKVFLDTEPEHEKDRLETDSLVSYVSRNFTSLFQTDVPKPQIHEWVAALTREIKEEFFSKEKFLCLLNDYLICYNQYSKDVFLWNKALNILTMGVELHSDEVECVHTVLSTLILGTALVHDFRLKEGKIREFAIYDERLMLRRIASNLALIFDIDSLATELHKSLPELLIQTAIIGLYQRHIKSDDPSANRTIHTLLGFNGVQKFNINSSIDNPILFSDYSTINIYDFESERHDLLLLPLFFKDEEYGIMLMPFDPRISVETYETLCANISTAVKGAELIKEIEYRNDLLNAVNGAAAILLEPDVDKFEENLVAALGVVAKTLNVSRMSIWKNHMDGNESNAAILHEWRINEELKLTGDNELNISYSGGFEAWWNTLSKGECINNYVSERPESEREYLTLLRVKSFVVAPVILNDHFWGFVGFDDYLKGRRFSENEEMVLRSVSKLIANALLRQDMARNLQSSLEQVVEASKAKSDFLSNMSHEMRTPMNAIIGMTSIGKKAKDTDEKNHALCKIEEASSHLLGVINDVLDMSKIEANKLELASVTFDFQRMLQKVITVIRFRLDEKKQILSVNIDPQIPHFVIGDDQRIAQVITNLMSNAVKFTPVGGRISLEASVVGMIDGICELCVEVSDSGIGISPDKREKIFEAFEQAESGTSRVYGGTGLGLVISKRIVELMDGKIWVESELGKGSKFIFTAHLHHSLNDCLCAADEQNNHVNSMDSRFAGKKMLLAEDIEINREILLSVLEDTGIEIDCAANGQEALDMITANPQRYDIVFMDVQMPTMDGYEATRAIRSLPVIQDTKLPIIAMTANVFKSDIENCLAAGMDDHLGKPLDINRVLEVLRKYL